MNFEKQLKEYIEKVDGALNDALAVPENRQKKVYEAMRYSVMAGGKRLRPVLALAACEMVGGRADDAMPFALALECIHTYSLIHDDLPCMDNDDLRRGKPTCHKVFGEANALLAGDGLLTLAFEIMSGGISEVSAERRLKIINTVAQCAGCDGMVGGQTVDLEYEGKKTDEETLGYIHKRKTSALIRAALAAGAIAGGADDARLGKICAFADGLGLAFQIRDDILDITGDTRVLGKNVGSDAENEKTTYATLLGIDAAQDMLAKVTADAESALDIFGSDAKFLKALAEYLVNRKK